MARCVPGDANKLTDCFDHTDAHFNAQFELLLQFSLVRHKCHCSLLINQLKQIENNRCWLF